MAHVRLDRGIVDHWIYKDAEYFKVWFEMLHRARYAKDPKTDLQDGELYTINYGEFMFGRISWSERLNVSEQRLRTLLKRLIQDDMITLVSSYRRFSIYKIQNYEKFNQQSSQQETLDTEGIDDPANHQDNHPATSSQPAANQQPTTKEESNTDKQAKQVNKKDMPYSELYESFWNEYPNKIGKKEAYAVWQRLIKEKKEPQLIIECAMNYASSCKANKTELKFIKHPKTFLNSDRYLDYKSPVVIYHAGGDTNAQSSPSHSGNGPLNSQYDLNQFVRRG